MSATNVKSPKRRGRPVTPLISREATIQAAIELVDTDGLEALSLQKVARALGVSAPSLYYHFKDKEELLRLIARELLREIGASEVPASEWEERAIGLSLATRRVILLHPNAAPLMLRFFPRSLMLGAYEQTLRQCPYPAEHHMVILEALEKLTYGTALFAAAAQTQRSNAMPAFKSSQYPKLGEAMELAPTDGEELFKETLRTLFDGFRARFGNRQDTGEGS